MTVWTEDKHPYRICQDLWEWLKQAVGSPESSEGAPPEDGWRIQHIDPGNMTMTFNRQKQIYSMWSERSGVEITVGPDQRISLGSGENFRFVDKNTGQKKLQAFVQEVENFLPK